MIVKKKLFSVMDEEGNQGYYLYDESTGEEKLFSEKRKNVIRLVDEDFLEEHEDLKKNDRRANKVGLTLVGGTLGMLPGMATGNGKVALATTAAGAGLGYLAGKKLGKISDKKYDKFRDTYVNSDEETKEYLRRKREKELDRRTRYESAVIGGYLAGR